MDVLSSFSPCLQSSRIQLPPRHVSHVHHVTEMALPPSCRKLQEIRKPATKLNLHFNTSLTNLTPATNYLYSSLFSCCKTDRSQRKTK